MEKFLSVFLCSEIDAGICRKLAVWLSDKTVCKYMNEKSGAAADIIRLSNTVYSPMLSYFFNQGGRFFAIMCNGEAVGFVKLVYACDKEYELVIAIGEKQMWGRGLGYSAVEEALKTAFFEWRANKINAKVHKNNTRSLRLFRHAGFEKTEDGETYISFSLSFEKFLRLKTEDSGAKCAQAKPECKTAQKLRA
jgi:hypothetical protein